MFPATFKPETIAKARQLAELKQTIAVKQMSGDEILQGIVEQLQKFRDLPNEVAELSRQAEALEKSLVEDLATELVSAAGVA